MRVTATVPFLLAPILPVLAGCQSKPSSVEISVIEGHRSVLVYGRPFPDDRIEVRRREVVLHDEHGRDWFHIPVDERTADAMRHGPYGHGPMMAMPAVNTMPAHGMPAMPLPTDEFPGHWGDQPPPVMLGVMLEPGGEAAQRRGADPGRSSHIPDLAEHHPAGRHGLQDGDVIVGFNGGDDGRPEAIRGQLRQMKPGEQITFKVLRGDGPEMKAMETTVTVEAFDLDKMIREAAGMPGPGFGPGPDGDPFLDLHMRLDRIEGMLEEILRRMDQRNRGPMGGGPGAGPGSGPGPGPGRGPGPAR